jgi:predicted GIY-YIG superfamily endonuclease
MHGQIYLLHFARPVGNLANPRGQARHYIGWALDAQAREQEHRAGRGAALTRAAVALGIDWRLYVLAEGDRALERRLKNLRAAPRLCPVCGCTHPGGRLHVPTAAQLALDLDPDPFDVPAPAWPAWDAYEAAYTRAWRRASAQRYEVGELIGEMPY